MCIRDRDSSDHKKKEGEVDKAHILRRNCMQRTTEAMTVEEERGLDSLNCVKYGEGCGELKCTEQGVMTWAIFYYFSVFCQLRDL